MHYYNKNKNKKYSRQKIYYGKINKKLLKI